MTYASGLSLDLSFEDRVFERGGRRTRRSPARAICCLLALAGSGATVAWMIETRPPAKAEVASSSIAARPIAGALRAAPPAAVSTTGFGVLAGPAFALGFVAGPIAESAPLGAGFAPFAPVLAVAAAAPVAPLVVVAAADEPPATGLSPAGPDTAMPMPALPQLVAAVPLPAPRPLEFRMAAATPVPSRGPTRQAAARNRTVVAAAPAPDNRSFFEKLFGGVAPPARGPALAFAAPEDGVSSVARTITSAPMWSSVGGTAVYDIAAHTVTLPNGTRLEAHSGLGDKLDDPSQVHVRMRGPTPPHVYDLTMRESLFHGVRALRLTPTGGEGRIFGRNGLLAHTYMLGPNGDSNGCVSFRNYEAFLQAYLSGQVKRLEVVAGRG